MRIQDGDAAAVDGISKLAADEQASFDIEFGRSARDGGHLEIYRIRLQFPARVAMRQAAIVVFPHDQDGPLGRISLMANI